MATIADRIAELTADGRWSFIGAPRIAGPTEQSEQLQRWLIPVMEDGKRYPIRLLVQKQGQGAAEDAQWEGTDPTAAPTPSAAWDAASSAAIDLHVNARPTWVAAYNRAHDNAARTTRFTVVIEDTPGMAYHEETWVAIENPLAMGATPPNVAVRGPVT